MAGRLRGVAAAFEGVPDPRMAVLDALPEIVRPSGALLATVLGQDIRLGALSRLVRELHGRLGDRLLRVESADWPELEKACRFGFLAEWPHKDALAGWVLSVSDFLRFHGDPSRWMDEFNTPAGAVETMARELPWMGSRSPSKIKGWRLVRWLARSEVPGTKWATRHKAGLVVPVAAIERPLRSLGWLPASWSEWPTAQRQEWLGCILNEVDASDPACAWMPMETILSRGRTGPACQDHLRGCKSCPVLSDCPTPVRF